MLSCRAMIGEPSSDTPGTQDHLGINLRVVDASKEFYAGLKGVTDPEKKRKFIGGAFIDAFEAEVGIMIQAPTSPRF